MKRAIVILPPIGQSDAGYTDISGAGGKNANRSGAVLLCPEATL